MLKIAISPDGEIKTGQESHAQIIGRNRGFDKWVRAIFWEEKKILYFRLYAPDGDYQFPDEETTVKALDVCHDALELLKRRGLIPKRVKVSFWDRPILYKWGIAPYQVLF